MQLEFLNYLLMLQSVLSMLLVGIALIVLFLLRKKVSKLMYLAVILLTIATLTMQVNIVVAVAIIFIIDLYTESKEYIIGILKKLAATPIATNGGAEVAKEKETKADKNQA